MEQFKENINKQETKAEKEPENIKETVFRGFKKMKSLEWLRKKPEEESLVPPRNRHKVKMTYWQGRKQAEEKTERKTEEKPEENQ